MPSFTALYFAGMLAEIVIRAPYDRVRKSEVMRERRFTTQEQVLLLALMLGMFVLPLVYATTDWLAFADVALPAWAGWLGVVLLAGALFVFWRGHRDLGRNWSPTLEVRAQHELVTGGIYGVIRHPMYASQWLWALAQPLLLHNWLAGAAGLVVFVPFYFLRVRAEERMMLDLFGDAYRRYMREVGGVLPR
ncbi:MAG TPA: protein-S-isoprenylcysteine O-methyltransferase [Nannocystis sp.]|jgi:protein-S-isoprenylcysteine O-methyltransferase Ste14